MVMNPRPAIYKRHRFPPQIIAHAVWLYFRFPLSLRLVEEMLLERGIVVSYETIRRWAINFGADYAHRLKRKAPSRHDIWFLDEVVITINGEKRYLWRAVDQDGYVLDEIVQIPRDTKAARRLLARLLRNLRGSLLGSDAILVKIGVIWRLSVWLGGGRSFPGRTFAVSRV
jgi:putative transposase